MRDKILKIFALILIGGAIVYATILASFSFVDKLGKRESDVTVEEIEKQEHEVQQVQESQQEVISGDIVEPMPDEYYDDVDLGAYVIHAENSVEVDGEKAGWYTLSVAYNRIEHPNYPNNLHDVIYQMGQYECTWNGGLYKEDPTDVEVEISAEIKQTGGIIPKNVIYASEFPQGSGIYEKIGNTYYCYE